MVETVMKPILYATGATTFESNGIGSLNDVISCHVVEQLNGDFSLEMQLMDSDVHFKYLQIGSIIVAKPNATDNRQAFVVEEISKGIDGIVDVYATHIAQHRTKLIPIDVFSSTSLAQTLTQAKSKSMENNPFDLITDKTSTTSFAIDVPRTFRELLGGKEGSILDVYGGEYRFDNFNISLLKNRGRETDVRILYGINMTTFDVDDEFSFNLSITGILPFWYSEDNGLVVGQIQRTTNASEFSYNKTIPVDFSNEFDEKPTAQQLNQMAQTYLSERGKMQRNLKVSFEQIQTMFTGDKIANFQNLQLGDSVQVIFSKYDINYQTRIIETDFDVLTEQYNSMTVGDKQTSVNDAIATIAQNVVDDFNLIAGNVSYNSNISGLNANTVQGAIDEIDGLFDDIGETRTLANTNKNIANNTSVVVGSLALPKGKWIVNGSIFYPKASANNSTGWVYVGTGTGTGNNPQTNGTCNIDTYVGHVASKSVIYELTEESTTLNLVGWQNSGATINNCVGFMKAIRIK